MTSVDYITPDANDDTSYGADRHAGRIIVHRVGLTDTLASIAIHYYGDARLFRYILDHNERHIHNPNQLVPGTELAIPRHPMMRWDW